MSSIDPDTIAAVATPAGRGGVGIVRISGAKARAIGEAISGLQLKPRHAHFAAFTDGDGRILDSGISLYFPAPRSFTGEDIVELQAHGGPVVLDLLMGEICRQGARQARAGEFSERAYLNNKLDLLQAEAIADLINSTTERAAINASRSLQGEFSRKIDNLVVLVTRLRVYVEAAIDFPEEEIDFLNDSQVHKQLQDIIQQCSNVIDEARQGTLIQEGMKLVIAGKPNAGKSSLLNALSGQDSAIVTPIEGTTRDVLREHIQIDGMPLHIVDTAGLRDSQDQIELEGIRRAWHEMESADRILLVVDGNTSINTDLNLETLWPEKSAHLKRAIPVTIILNKCDLTGGNARIEETLDATLVYLSAMTGEGMELLRQHLLRCMGLNDNAEASFSARRRHLNALTAALQVLINGQHQLLDAGAGELLAEDLRQCQNLLGEITGAVSTDVLLGEIFSSFCIGK